MGVAGQFDLALVDRDLFERRDDLSRELGELVDRILDIEPECRQHLVVARPAEMDATARFADGIDEPSLERRVHVLVGKLDGPLAPGMSRAQGLEPGRDRRALERLEQALSLEHARMRNRGADVVFDEAGVEQVVLSRGKTEDPLVQRFALVPESGHCRLIPAARQR